MTVAEAKTNREFLFIPGSQGNLFSVLYRPPTGIPSQGGVLFVPPFAEEMNKSRRMCAAQAQEFAKSGYAVLMADFYGSGDSAGDFSDARWGIWRQDLRILFDWLAGRCDGTLNVWGLRLGSILAIDLIDQLDAAVSNIILWQPVVSGRSVLTEFLRIQLAAGIFGGEGSPRTTVNGLQERLHAGESLEIAGYELSAELAKSLNAASLSDYCPKSSELHWLEVSREGKGQLGADSTQQIDEWAGQGVKVNSVVVAGPRFWGTAGVTECPELIEATNEIFPVVAPSHPQ